MELPFLDFLRTFDILPDTTYEILLTTTTKDGKLNTAPFGVKFQQPNEIIESFAYDGSTTLSNLKIIRACIINITQDPILFYSALSKHDLDIELETNSSTRSLAYQKVKTLGSLQPVKGVQGYIVARVIAITPQGVKYLITLKPISCTYSGKSAVFSRGSAALIEMMVHLSRLGVYSDWKKNKELIKKIKELNSTVKKTGNSLWISLGSKIVKKAENFQEPVK